jgi:hypothetical protein
MLITIALIAAAMVEVGAGGAVGVVDHYHLYLLRHSGLMEQGRMGAVGVAALVRLQRMELLVPRLGGDGHVTIFTTIIAESKIKSPKPQSPKECIPT